MKFGYKKLDSGVTRPIIPVEVKFKDKVVRYFALIDSGADINIFHSEIAELLGIDTKRGEEKFISGITQGEVQKYYIHQVSLIIGGWEYQTKVGFMPTLSKIGHGLLGQNGFFNLFKSVNFDFGKKDIELKNKN